MPATQRGQAYKLSFGKWGLRYYDARGRRRRKTPFATKSAALSHYREIIEPQLRGGPTPLPDLSLGAFVSVYLDRHAAIVRPRTIEVLRERLAYAARAYGDVSLRDLQGMSDELASWRGTLPAGSRYGVLQALRQALEAAVRWGYITRNPAKLAGRNPQPPPRVIRAFSPAELDAIAAELSPIYQSLPAFAAATGLRPEEWSALRRGDVDRAAGIVNITRTVSSGQVVELAKTTRSRRQVPLTRRVSVRARYFSASP